MAGCDGPITVEVVYALPEIQLLIELKVAPGTTVRQAIVRSGILQRFPQIDLAGQKVGICGRLAKPDAVLEEGDRVEIYRPLIADPKDARRRRAKQKV
ncbi:MAG: RnfH family protein [Burkholderiales bacterium]|nr:RnfH family protein [Burkholderiales bacterium]